MSTSKKRSVGGKVTKRGAEAGGVGLRADAVVAELAAAGGEQAQVTRASKLAKRIKVDHALAVALWDRGGLAAKLLAVLIADPTAVAPTDIDRWCAGCDDAGLLMHFARFAASTAHGRACAHRWIESRSETQRMAGWQCLSWLVRDGGVDAEEARGLLRLIEARFDAEPESVRECMVPVLAFMGMRLPVCAKDVEDACDRLDVHIELTTEPEGDHSQAGARTSARGSVVRGGSPRAGASRGEKTRGTRTPRVKAAARATGGQRGKKAKS